MEAIETRTWLARANEVAPGTAVSALSIARFAWLRPKAQEVLVGVGTAQDVVNEQPRAALAGAEGVEVRWQGAAPDAPGPWFGGFAFDWKAPRAEEWSGFGNARFLLPRFGICGRGGREWAFAVARSEAELDAALEDGLAGLSGSSGRRGTGVAPAVLTRAENEASWGDRVRLALAHFADGRAEKIVAARRIDLELSAPLDAAALALTLAARHPACATWLLRQGDSAFVGATPETLVEAADGLIDVDALAGTLSPGASAPGDKEEREHAVVVQSVREALRPLCLSIDVEARPSLLELRNVVHLRTRVKAKLAPGISPAEVALALHPTPAVCGRPKEAARGFIRAHEGFDRGWYSGAVGWLGEKGAHLCVALRCGLFRGDRGFVYAGAGLVAGSDPRAEWVETSRKASAVIDALGAAL